MVNPRKKYRKQQFIKKILGLIIYEIPTSVRYAYKSVCNSYGVKNKAPQAKPGAAPLSPAGNNCIKKIFYTFLG